MDVSPWIDCRFVEPIEDTLARIEAQQHRRFLKSHLPADGLPLFDAVRYIHVARDGRDALPLLPQPRLELYAVDGWRGSTPSALEDGHRRPIREPPPIRPTSSTAG